MRLIEADAAIEALNEQIEQCNKALGTFDISPKDEYAIKVERASLEAYKEQLENLPSVQLGTDLAEVGTNLVSKQVVAKFLDDWLLCLNENCHKQSVSDLKMIIKDFKNLPSAQPDLGKYEYHYDHTDCIWYRPEERSRCPVTCAQYRDGWNDAMNYIFRDGKGYRPYRRGEQYE